MTTEAPETAASDDVAKAAGLVPLYEGGLYAKLAGIMGELATIPRDRLRHVEVQTRQGGTYSYDYITEATLMEELRPRLAREGIASFYSDEIVRNPDPGEQGDNLTVVRVTWTLVHGEDRETLSAEGYGTDYGDKGANKAKTSALRYLLWKTFLFASPDDPEAENVERRASGGGARSGGVSSGGPAATDKQKAMVSRLVGELDEKGVTLDGARPYDAIHVRTSVEDMTKSQASAMIDLLTELKKSDEVAFATPEGSTPPLDGILGAPRDDGDFPPEPEGTGPSDAGYA